MVLDYGFLNSGPSDTQKDSMAGFQQVPQMKQLPIDIDLSEFMTDINMDYSGKYFV